MTITFMLSFLGEQTAKKKMDIRTSKEKETLLGNALVSGNQKQ